MNYLRAQLNREAGKRTMLLGDSVLFILNLGTPLITNTTKWGTVT